jgi:hypothetical protein
MKLAIMGCGPGGSYLYRLLRLRKPEVEIDLFDIPHTTDCGIKSCGWAVAFPQFAALCREIGLPLDTCILKRHDRVSIEGVELKANLAVIDKPLLIKWMLEGKRPRIPEAQLDQYDRIIDATGQRAYLPSYSPRSVDAIETRTKVNSPMLPTAFINDNGGYTWLIPLNNGEAHLGSLSPRGIDESKREMGKLRAEIDAGSTICVCQEQIWVSGPILPFTQGNVWGLGQSIGLVEPLSGIGITPAMDSARIMVENWDDPVSYEREILSRYSYMVRQALIVEKLIRRQKPNILDAFLSWRASHISGIYPSVIDLVRLVRTALKSRRIKGVR